MKKFFRLPYLPIWLAPLILLSPLLLTGKAMFWGLPALQFVPWWTWAWETLLDGHLPLWNPLLGMGAPLLANYQSALFYPPNWLYFFSYVLGGIGVMAWMQSLVVALHLIWAGVGMARLTKRLGLGTLAQTVSGLAFSLSGYLVARAWFASINAAAAWLPWVLLAAFDAVQSEQGKKRLSTSTLPHPSPLPKGEGTASSPFGGGLRWGSERLQRLRWGKLGLVIGMQLLAGHAQTTWYTLLLTGLWIAYWEWRKYSDLGDAHSQFWDQFKHRALTFLTSEAKLALAVLMGAALAAVQLLPTAVYLSQSQRAGAVDFDIAMTYSFWPWRLLGLLAPGLFGSPATGDYWGYANFWEDAVYVGLLPFLLAVGVVLRFLPRSAQRNTKKSKKSIVIFLLGIIFVAFTLALGKNTPIFPWLYRHVPTFDMFQAPTRISIWAVFALALLAGIGAETWRRPVAGEKNITSALYWVRLGTAGAFAVSLGAGLAWYAMGDVRPTFIRATALAGFWALGAGGLSLTAPRNLQTGGKHLLWSWAVALWVAADLLIAGWGLNPGIGTAFYTRPASTSAQVQAQLGDGRLYLPPDQEYTLKYDSFFRFETFAAHADWGRLQAALLPNENMLAGIPSINNFDPLVPERYARWLESLESAHPANREHLLDLMAVTVVESVRSGPEMGVGFRPRGESARVRWVPCARPAGSADDAWEQVFSGGINFGDEVILENAHPLPIEGCYSASDGQVNLTSESPNQLAIQIDAESSGWLVVSDTWYPGWKAWVDGDPAPVLRANYLFRAVEVPAGARRVVFKYRPVEFYVGLGLSIIMTIFMIKYWLRYLRLRNSKM